MHKTASLIVAAMLAAGTATSGGAQSSTGASQSCASLVGRDFGGGIEITSAAQVAAAAKGTLGQGPFSNQSDLPAHCLVKGIIDKRTGAGGKTYGIQFALALPTDWSGRFLVMGGGGLNGTVGQPWGPVAAGMTPALARGFAVVAHDSGHAGTVWDSSFNVDQRAALDFAETSVLTVTKAARAITESFYAKPIAHSYMTGCSTGGREGMLAIERYPELFDGVVIGAPAMMTGDSNAAIDRMRVAFNQAASLDAEGKPIISEIFTPAVRALLSKGILDQCDALDGLKDGVVENVSQCRFDPKKLVCKPGQTEGCFSPKLASAIDQGFQPAIDSLGRQVYPRFPYDPGVTNLQGGILPSGAPGPFGPTTQALSYDLDAAALAAHNDPMQRLIDTNYWTNLNTFLDRGGKTIFFHGTADLFFSPWATWDWWARALQTNGPRFAEASRFYMVPGMLHCAGGDSFDRFDLLGEVVNWVEQGKAPNNPVASRSDGSASRPLCQFPAHAQYIGGDATKPESYQCKMPSES
ncbi:tannase/feruloyl esterase family alpha/beta hydrolase [Altererythrobacter salegens]|uniref:Tannase/feruloyl esterase family alpha/beta hydrolase n=1 Tax=Croceibacterium salegens TaxID=1737568 RepID=A0A6I4SUG1_9SPHN|nr:tannase/feruloyl esterase family alpha/beta hydrolase [Croceibacterium salegens]MXO59541.1 tannase/feruloyl esterase family alpha/beta hydrolase [Croceibacterium salegens]